MTASLLQFTQIKFYDNNGNLNVGGKIYTYAAGTSTPITTYTDYTAGTPNTNPIIIDSKGEAQIWITTQIKINITDSIGTQITGFPIDHVNGASNYFSPYGNISATTVQDAIQEEVDDLAASSGSSLIGFIQAGTGSVARTVQAKERDIVSPEDFGSINDGTDNPTAITNFNNASGYKLVPTGTYYSSTMADTSLDGPFKGNGQIKTSAGNKRAPYFAAVKAAPSSSIASPNVVIAFNGDLSKCQFPVEHRITGAATLGQPNTGYLYTPEAMPYYTWLYNASGWNNATADNTGRTGVAAYRTRVSQVGQGDAVAYNASVLVNATRAGSTHWLANPAGVILNGDMFAGQDGVYFNPYETVCDDAGFDVACVGAVYRFSRANGTGAKGAIWNGVRYQSQGAVACNAMISGGGSWGSGLDYSMIDFGANQAAISLAASQRIYFNNAAAADSAGAKWQTTTFNPTYIEYDSGSARMRLFVGGAAPVTIHATAAVNFSLGVNVATGKDYQLNGVKLFTGTAPTIASGFGTSPSVVVSNGTAAFQINVGTGGTASSGVITMPVATTGWMCTVSPAGAPQAGAVTLAVSTSASSVTITNYTLSTGIALAWASGTILNVKAVAF